MQGLTPYNSKYSSFGDDDDYSAKPRYIIRKPKRRFYLNRIGILLIAVSLLAAVLIWLFSATTGLLVLDDKRIYFTGVLSASSETSENFPVSFDIKNDKYLTPIAEPAYNQSYFLAENVFYTLSDAESEVLSRLSIGENRVILMFAPKNIKLIADKNMDINRRIAATYNAAYNTLTELGVHILEGANQAVSIELFEYRAEQMNKTLQERLKNTVSDGNKVSAAMTHFYTLAYNNLNNPEKYSGSPKTLIKKRLETAAYFCSAVNLLS